MWFVVTSAFFEICLLPVHYLFLLHFVLVASHIDYSANHVVVVMCLVPADQAVLLFPAMAAPRSCFGGNVEAI